MITETVFIPRKYVNLRDEFCCPITRELMIDPVIAADGHSYDREAIEMWLRTHQTSPKTGQPLDNSRIVPNHNLKRLVKDLIAEGGTALYTTEEEDGEEILPGGCPYRYALVPEPALILKCLGPVESDWNLKSFRVTDKGCLGGRKRPANYGGCDFMHFNDPTVSRTHFHISYTQSERQFRIQDKGSAGGTYIRVPFGVPKPIFPGLMIMLGKHQLLVKEVGESSSLAAGRSDARRTGSRPTTPVTTAGEAAAERAAAQNSESDVKEQLPSSIVVEEGAEDDASIPDTPAGNNNPCFAEEDEEEAAASLKIMELTLMKETKLARNYKSVELECYAPEGTPIQGFKYVVTKAGASLGRKQSNSIPFSHMVDGNIMGIDSSISGEHARICYDSKDDCMHIWDGTETKPSTNGTWFRLSPMHKESEPYPVHHGQELLIGTVRFSVAIETMVVEKDALEVWKP